MKLLRWNSRGIRGGVKIGVNRELVQKYIVLFLGVVET